MEAGMIMRLSLAALRLIARLVPKLERAAWLREWDAEFNNRRARLEAVTPTRACAAPASGL